MKILHILRSQPGEMVRFLVAGLSKGGKSREVPLYQGQVDYDRLVEEIFQSDLVICWW